MNYLKQFSASLEAKKIPNGSTDNSHRAYSKPELIEYGSVGNLTASTGSANGDAGQGMMV